MDREGNSHSVYANNDKFDAEMDLWDAKIGAKVNTQVELLQQMLKNRKSCPSSRSPSRRHSNAHASKLPSTSRSHLHRHHH